MVQHSDGEAAKAMGWLDPPRPAFGSHFAASGPYVPTPVDLWVDAAAQLVNKHGGFDGMVAPTMVLYGWIRGGASKDAVRRPHVLFYRDPWTSTERAVITQAVELAGWPPVRPRRSLRTLMRPDYRVSAAIAMGLFLAYVVEAVTA